MLSSVGLRIYLLYPLQSGKTSPQQWCLRYYSKSHLMVRHMFWRFGVVEYSFIAIILWTGVEYMLKCCIITIMTNYTNTLFVCERELETKQNCNILTPTLLAITTFLSRSPGLLNWRPGGPALWLSLPHLVPKLWLNFLCTQLYNSSHPLNISP